MVDINDNFVWMMMMKKGLYLKYVEAIVGNDLSIKRQ